MNQAYAGFSGGPFAQDDTIGSLYYYKPLPGDRMAVLLMNTDDNNAHDLTFNLPDVPGIRCARDGNSPCLIRDLNTRKDLGNFTGSYTASQVGSHDAVFLLLS